MDGPQSSVLVLRVSKKFAKPLSDHIRKNFWEDKTYRISPAKDSEDLLIPILPSSSEATKAVLPQLLGDNFQQDHPYILSVDSSLLIPSKSQPRAPGIEHIRHILTR